MHGFGWAKVAVHFAKGDPYSLYYREAFEHAGFRIETIEEVNAREIARFQVLVLCGVGQLGKGEETSVHDWVRKGGVVVCSGSGWGMEHALGLQPESKHLSNGLLAPAKDDRLWPTGADRARFFGGQGKKPSSCEIIASCGEFVGISRRKSGKGIAIFLAPHVGQTIRLMQSGRSVECDAIGPSDGSAILDDGVLRAEDGTVLDFRSDRCTVDGSPVPFFGYPHADAVREALIRAVVFGAEHRGFSMPVLWHWPHAAKAAAVLSLDCEEFERENVNQLHRMLSMFGMPAAWLVGLPGYSVDVYRAMRAWDHEVGLLFLTDDQSGWREEKLKIQFTALSRLSAQTNLMAARAQDGRWKGWNDFYDIAEVAGARVSLSKGGRQPGTSGFLFGTCHPFTPTRRDGSHYLLTEIPYQAFHPGTITPDRVAEHLVKQTVSRYGCFHMVYPSNAIGAAETAASLLRILSICKQQRMEFMLPEQIHRFERGRRQLRVQQKLFDNEGILVVSSDVPLEGLTILVNGPRLAASVRDKEIVVATVERYGAKFNVIQFDLEAKQQVEIRVAPIRVANAA